MIPLRKALRDKVFNRLTINFEYPDVEKVEHKDLMARYLESCGHKINGESIVIAHSKRALRERKCVPVLKICERIRL